MELSLTNKHGMTCKISRKELDQFYILLEKGLSTKQCLTLAFDHGEKLIQEMEKGRNLQELLFNLQKGTFYQRIFLLTQYLPLKESIHVSRNIEAVTKLFTEELMKQVLYPSILFLTSLLMSLFFIHDIIPQMNEYIDQGFFVSILYGIKNINICIFILGCIFIIIGIFTKIHKKFHQFIYRMTALFIFPFKTLISIEFCYLFQALSAKKISTLHLCKILKKFKKNLYCEYLIDHFIEQLQHGMSIQEAFIKNPWIDPLFNQYFKMGHMTNIQELLDLFIEQRTLYLKQIMKKYSIGFQIFSYLNVGVMVICMYQILLMPMNMLYTF